MPRPERFASSCNGPGRCGPISSRLPPTLTAIAGICHHLDGLPLAIELAAARVDHLPPAAMLERLDPAAPDRLSFLTSGARDRPARHRTMRDAIVWSYDLLDAAEQTLFQDLTVFPGGFRLEAALWVAGSQGGGVAGEVDVVASCHPATPPPYHLRDARLPRRQESGALRRRCRR